MRPRTTSAAISILIAALASGPSWASNYRYGPDPDRDIYFGRVSHWEGDEAPILFRDGQEERLDVNFPIGPGDAIQTPAGTRAEITFDLGTTLRLSYSSSVRIGTILAPSITSKKKVTNFYLDHGELEVEFYRYDRSELFQVFTAGAATKISHKAKILLKVDSNETTTIRVLAGKAFTRHGATQTEEQKVTRPRPFVVDAEGNGERRHRVSNAAPSSFEKWIEKRSLQRTREPIRVRGLPKAGGSVGKFLGVTSHQHGRWLTHPVYGSVWRPHANDDYPGNAWQPYFHGRWTSLVSERFWVPNEPWGWVPYHFGLWSWDGNQGWLWIPGSSFAPAWVSWDFDGSYASWRPWALWDWYWYAGANPYRHYCGYGIPYLWNQCGCRGYGSYYDYYAYGYRPSGQIDNGYVNNVPPESQPPGQPPFVGGPPPMDTEDRDSHPPMRRPKEFDDVFERAVRGFERGDPAIRQSLRDRPDGVIAMEQSQILRAPAHEGGLRKRGDSVERETRFVGTSRPPTSPATAVSPTATDGIKDRFRDSDRIIAPSTGSESHRGNPHETSETAGIVKEVVTPVLRVFDGFRNRPVRTGKQRDWNPDSDWAQALNQPFRYDSRANRVASPGLRQAVREAARRQGRRRNGFSELGSSTSSSSTSGYTGNTGQAGGGGQASSSGARSGGSSGTARGKSSGSARGAQRGRNNN